MFDVITFGSATLDVFVPYDGKLNLFAKNKKISPFLPLGEKLEGVKISFHSGGGGINTAATFANQGFKVAYCGMVGNDYAGDFVLEDVKRNKISQRFIFKTKEKTTSCSVIFTGEKGKVILPYRGAARCLDVQDIPLEELKSKWFYLAPLSGKLRKSFFRIIRFAKKNNIKVFLNPSKYQLKSSVIKKAIKQADVLMLNQEEASFLTGVSFKKEKLIFQKINQWVKGICIMTRGRKGSIVSDGKFLYTTPVLKKKIVDETGTGDSFGAGFVADYMKTSDIVSAIQFATANSAANLERLGAKEGILKAGESWKKVKVKKTKLG